MLSYRNGELQDSTPQAVAWPKLAVLGHPIEHSLSPTMHAAALTAAGLTARYEAVDVEADSLGLALGAAFEAGVHGLNVTLPHKSAALQHVVRSSEEVDRIGASNTLLRSDKGWVAHNTDARGFASALQRWLGRELGAALADVYVLGAGGAARAVLESLSALGARRTHVVARSPERANWVIERGIEWIAWDEARFDTATLVVQATSVGVRENDPNPIDGRSLRSSTCAMDLCYGDARTAFLRDAQASGCRVEDGFRMLVAQGALAFTMWYGGEVPLAPMARALGRDW